MTRELEVGKDYGAIFGVSADKGCHLTYLGGNMWRAEKPGTVRDIDSAASTAKALAYINQPSIQMGSVGAGYHR